MKDEIEETAPHGERVLREVWGSLERLGQETKLVDLSSRRPSLY